MADQEQLDILKQGVGVWNKWRYDHPGRKIDLSNVHLSIADLAKVNLREANLIDINFGSVVDLTGACFANANLTGCDFGGANLSQVDFSGACLDRVRFAAKLYGANLSRASLINTNFGSSTVGETIFGGVNLTQAIGLESMYHWAPSILSVDTITFSKGRISEVFLRGCGLSDWEIESVKLYNPDLNNDEFIDIQNRIFDLRNRQAIQISSLFISYSHTDGQFVDKIEVYLNKKGVRFWRDIHDAKAGRLEKQIDRAMRLNPTVLLILSEHSLQSDWVEHEVRTSRSLEKEMGRDVLCPIALDDKWKNSPWSKRIMEQVMEYNILDFSAWEDDTKFGNAFNKLIDGLELFYK